MKKIICALALGVAALYAAPVYVYDTDLPDGAVCTFSVKTFRGGGMLTFYPERGWYFRKSIRFSGTLGRYPAEKPAFLLSEKEMQDRGMLESSVYRYRKALERNPYAYPLSGRHPDTRFWEHFRHWGDWIGDGRHFHGAPKGYRERCNARMFRYFNDSP